MTDRLAVIAIVISVVSLIVSVLQSQQSSRLAREQVDIAKLESSFRPTLEAAVARQLPISVADETFFWEANLMYEGVPADSQLVGVDTWYALAITNVGNRPFSVSGIDLALIKTDGGANRKGTFSYGSLNQGVFSSIAERATLPIVVEPGRQSRLLLKVRLPILDSITTALQLDFPGPSPTYEVAFRQSFGRRGRTLTNAKVKLTEVDDAYLVEYEQNPSLFLELRANIAGGNSEAVMVWLP